MIALLYGPSGIGKSTAIYKARELCCDIRFEEFDELVDKEAKRRGLEDLHSFRTEFGTSEFLKAGVEAIAALESPLPLVVDVGAGACDATDFKAWLQQHPSILLIATPEVAFARVRVRPTERRTLEEYQACEFSLRRIDLYEAATYRIDTTGRDAESVSKSLLDVLGRCEA